MRSYINVDATVTFLSDEEQRELIADAQDVQLIVETGADGSEIYQYGKTRESDAALTKLIQAFSPLISSVARRAKVLDMEEAEAVCYERFVKAVREYDLTASVPFSRDIGAKLRFEISDRDRTSDLVSVKENSAAKYWRLIHKHDGDVAAAYEECRTTSNAFNAATFLAVHRAVGHIESLNMSRESATGDVSCNEAFLADPSANFEEDLALIDLVRWAFTQVSDREEQILRLRYGFYDTATENIRSRAGFRNDRTDLVMSDREVAQALHSTTPTVSRLKRQALDTMREAMDELACEGA